MPTDCGGYVMLDGATSAVCSYSLSDAAMTFCVSFHLPYFFHDVQLPAAHTG